MRPDKPRDGAVEDVPEQDRLVQDLGRAIARRAEAPVDPVDRAVINWMNSPGHRHNILDGTFTETGVGIAYLNVVGGQVTYEPVARDLGHPYIPLSEIVDGGLLEGIREISSPPRFLVIGTSEEYGLVYPDELPITESNPLRPLSPYAVSKVAAHWYARNYREAYGVHASSGILFNHESPRRGETFVTRKITRAVAAIEPPGEGIGQRPNSSSRLQRSAISTVFVIASG